MAQTQNTHTGEATQIQRANNIRTTTLERTAAEATGELKYIV